MRVNFTSNGSNVSTFKSYLTCQPLAARRSQMLVLRSNLWQYFSVLLYGNQKMKFFVNLCDKSWVFNLLYAYFLYNTYAIYPNFFTYVTSHESGQKYHRFYVINHESAIYPQIFVTGHVTHSKVFVTGHESQYIYSLVRYKSWICNVSTR